MESRYMFRAKRICDGTWHKGQLIYMKATKNVYVWDELEHDKTQLGECTSLTMLVDPSTIVQCTGLKDIKGKLIFEGDIVRLWSAYNPGNEWRPVAENADIENNRMYVAFSYEYVGGWIIRPTKEPVIETAIDGLPIEKGNITLGCKTGELGNDRRKHITRVEVIGNIHDDKHPLNPADQSGLEKE